MKNVLDSKEEFTKIDKSNMISNVDNFAPMAKEAIGILDKISINLHKKDFNKIVISGMGGSAISADIVNSVLANQIDIPIFIIRNYDIPKFTDKNTLFIIISYSGNTEEALSVFKHAREINGKIITITSGGKIEKLLVANSHTIIKIPGGLPPRASLPYLLFPLFKIFDKLNIAEGVNEQIIESLKILEEKKTEYFFDSPFKKNAAKKLAYKLRKKIPIVLGSIYHTDSAVLRWKTQFNENSKTTAVYNVFPELNHNELVNLAYLNKKKNVFSLIILRDRFENERIRLRIESTKEIIKESFPFIFEFYAEGSSHFARLLSLICLGDYTSVYLAVLKNIDPTPVVPIDLLKKELG